MLHDENEVDTKNDVLVLRPHLPFDNITYNLLDKGIRFIFDCLWEKESINLANLTPYNENGIAFVSGSCQNVDGWGNNLFFVPMSFWYIEYFDRIKTEDIRLNFSRDQITHNFLMPIGRFRPYRGLFLHLLGMEIQKSLHSMLWQNVSNFDAVEDETKRYTFEYSRKYEPKWYSSTYFTMVIETSQTDSVFITEKTFKPIMYGHPFMIYGSKNTLSTLQKYGFNTFPELFNELYDEIDDPSERAKFIVEQIKEFNPFLLKANKSNIDQKIFDNFIRFFDHNNVINNITNDLLLPIEKFLNDR
jgi:hypothetical protein